MTVMARGVPWLSHRAEKWIRFSDPNDALLRKWALD